MFFAAAGSVVAAAQNPGEPFLVSGDEGRHAVSVKRIQVGERVLIAEGDNSGLIAECEVVATRGKDELVLRVDQTWHGDSRTKLTVVLALIKGERMERAIEQLTEVGVGRIVPWASERSVVSLKGAAAGKIHKRLERKAFEAAKQCRQPTVPEVMAPCRAPALAEWLRNGEGNGEVGKDREANGSIIILHECASRGLDELTASDVTESSVLIVGPEGGLTESEIELFESLGGETWVMGRSVMRAGTAAVVAAGWLIGATGNWTKTNQNSQ